MSIARGKSTEQVSRGESYFPDIKNNFKRNLCTLVWESLRFALHLCKRK